MAALSDTFGAVLIGVVIASVLYGFTIVQTLYYYANYPEDPWHIKFLVATVLVSDSCHQGVITHVVFTYLIKYFGDVEQTERIIWSIVVEVFFNGFTTFVVQCFLAMRVYTLSKKNLRLFITGLVMSLVIAEFFVVLVFGIEAWRYDTFAKLGAIKALSMAVNILSAVTDIFIAVLLCWMLLLQRTGFRKSDTLINRLVVFSINTGLFTSLCALASLISIIVGPSMLIYTAFYFCIGRLYCNSLLATLNARKRLRGDGDEMLSYSTSSQRSGTIEFAVCSGLPPKPPGSRDISIKINTMEECIRDEPSSPCDAKTPEVV